LTARSNQRGRREPSTAASVAASTDRGHSDIARERYQESARTLSSIQLLRDYQFFFRSNLAGLVLAAESEIKRRVSEQAMTAGGGR
jgi:hypothetical protein